MLEYLKDYYVFMLILMVFSYLVPREEYRKYIQFFISIFVVVLLLKPLLQISSADLSIKVYEIFEGFNSKMEKIEWDSNEGETIYEYFFLEGEGK